MHSSSLIDFLFGTFINSPVHSCTSVQYYHSYGSANVLCDAPSKVTRLAGVQERYTCMMVLNHDT